jgi:hypothetical protein
MHDEAVKQINPDFDALLVFLANWEAIERSALGRILTAGQLADVQELERLFALPAEPKDGNERMPLVPPTLRGGNKPDAAHYCS